MQLKTVLFAGLYHETHSFLSDPTGLAAFKATAFNVGEAAIAKNLGNGSPSDGFLSTALSRGWTVLPTIQMAAMPSGPVEDEAIRVFEEAFFEALEREAERIDGIFLILHGAMVSETSDDVEGQVLARIRAVLERKGLVVPVVGVLDLHANVSQAMVDNSTLLCAYRENPHTDARETAVRAAIHLDELMSGTDVVQVHRPTRYVLPPTGVGSMKEPMRSVLAAARRIEAADPDIAGINVMAGYAYSDIADCGFSLNCSTRGPVAIASAYLDELVEVLEANLAAGYPQENTLDEALRQADALPDGAGPILLIEPADNIGGGTPGDATDLLGPLLATGRSGIVAALNDPEAVEECRAAGIGSEITLRIGAKVDRHHGAPITFSGRVRNITDGRFELELKNSHLASMIGTSADMGASAVVENEQAVILLTSKKMPPMDLGQLHSQGVRPEEARYVVVKAAVSHKDAYDPIARASFYVDTAGLCTSNLVRLPYSKLTGKRLSL